MLRVLTGDHMGSNSQQANMSGRILLIQDDPEDAGKIRDALLNSDEQPFEVEWVRRCCEGLERLARRRRQAKHRATRIAAVLVDLLLPDSQGIGTFDQLFLAAPQVPILVLSARQDEKVAQLAVQHGAHDYLLKDRLEGYMLPKVVANMLERAASAEALFAEKERAQVTLSSIADAVIGTGVRSEVTYLNTVAERLTGWSREDATGHPFEEVFRTIDATTREAARNPIALAIRDDKVIELTANCLLIRRDGVEIAIEDYAAPTHDRQGRVTGAVMAFHDVSTARAMALKMSHLAQHDSLTELPNRMLLNDRLIQAIAFARLHHHKLAVLFLDLDGFKHINESLGHNVADDLLRSVAQRLLQRVRTTATVSRQQGNEFVILLPEVADTLEAARSAEKILLALGATHHIGPHDLHITPSIGVAIYPDDGPDAEVLLKHADMAMHHARGDGRNGYQFFRPDMNVRALARRSLEADLCRAVERQEFQLHYQPVVDFHTGAILGAEALIRWHHPRRGPVPPAQFVPIAEERGLITAIGRWVLREACRQTREWQDAGLPSMCIAVNVSTVELRDKYFVGSVREVLVETGLESGCVELELTETFLMENSQATATVLEALRDMGVRIALDDFGTGYSSLSYLKRFPIDTLKIDRSFVCNIATDPDDACIVSAVIGMGKGLRMRVVAEGVETQEQLAFLQERNCSVGQGYYFSPAVGAAEFATLMGHTFPVPSPRERRTPSSFMRLP